VTDSPALQASGPRHRVSGRPKVAWQIPGGVVLAVMITACAGADASHGSPNTQPSSTSSTGSVVVGIPVRQHQSSACPAALSALQSVTQNTTSTPQQQANLFRRYARNASSDPPLAGYLNAIATDYQNISTSIASAGKPTSSEISQLAAGLGALESLCALQ
jgi:hypothetical protein